MFDTFCHASIPGIAAKHVIITPTCRTNRGKDGAFEEAVKRLCEEYNAVMNCDGADEVEFHVVLTVVRPPHPLT